MKPFLFMVGIVFAAPVWAGSWALQPEDQPFSSEDLSRLPGQSLLFYDGGETIYGTNGAYSYTYGPANGSGTAWGTYWLAEDGSVCVDFANGASRCDLLVRNGSRVVVLTEKGDRFPVREAPDPVRGD